jgi:c-di-GMP-binding flagellar brake protein YcgR
MFSFFGKKKPLKAPARAATGAEQKRTSFRMPVEFDVIYTLEGRQGRRKARANDLSSGGLRLATDEDFWRESVLDLDFNLPEDFLPEMMIEKEVYEQTPFGLRPETVRVQPPGFKPLHMRGKTLMAFFDKETRKFAYGIKFIDITQDMQEELSRFIHLWQLHYLRTRNVD